MARVAKDVSDEAVNRVLAAAISQIAEEPKQRESQCIYDVLVFLLTAEIKRLDLASDTDMAEVGVQLFAALQEGRKQANQALLRERLPDQVDAVLRAVIALRAVAAAKHRGQKSDQAG
jgi:hypothetical protein